MLLATFNVTIDNRKSSYRIYGDYNFDTQNELVGSEFKDYTYPEFNNLEAKLLVNGLEEDYEPKVHTFSGRKCDVQDMLTEFLTGVIMSNPVFEKLFLEKELDKLVNKYQEATINVQGKDIPLYILFGYRLDLYKSTLVTDNFIFYLSNETMIAFDTESHNLISDNIFGEFAYWESIEAIKKGTEHLVWGELPKEY